MPRSDTSLEYGLLKAHAENDNYSLCALYAEAAQAHSDINTACFLATQAYVFGLQSNHQLTEKLRAFLKKHEREE